MKIQTITKYKLYIGWNNQTHKREIKKAINIISNNKIMAFSKIDSFGFWNKTKENSFIIEMLSNKENPINDKQVYNIKLILEKELKQFLVLLSKEKIELIN